jgi:hypothetical protein
VNADDDLELLFEDLMALNHEAAAVTITGKDGVDDRTARLATSMRFAEAARRTRWFRSSHT